MDYEKIILDYESGKEVEQKLYDFFVFENRSPLSDKYYCEK